MLGIRNYRARIVPVLSSHIGGVFLYNAAHTFAITRVSFTCSIITSIQYSLSFLLSLALDLYQVAFANIILAQVLRYKACLKVKRQPNTFGFW